MLTLLVGINHTDEFDWFGVFGESGISLTVIPGSV